MNIRKQQGFTIIEVVLVLAIAGLIFLMVFIALPTLQRNQRDTQRRDDLARFSAQMSQYQANNKGLVPVGTFCNAAPVTTFVTGYMHNGTSLKWEDPATGNAYACNAGVALASTDTAGEWQYSNNAYCNGETITNYVAPAPLQPRAYAVAMKLEGAGIACLDNK